MYLRCVCTHLNIPTYPVALKHTTFLYLLPIPFSSPSNALNDPYLSFVVVVVVVEVVARSHD